MQTVELAGHCRQAAGAAGTVVAAWVAEQWELCVGAARPAPKVTVAEGQAALRLPLVSPGVQAHSLGGCIPLRTGEAGMHAARRDALGPAVLRVVLAAMVSSLRGTACSWHAASPACKALMVLRMRRVRSGLGWTMEVFWMGAHAEHGAT